MNTTLTAVRSSSGSTDRVRQQARLARERTVTRVGLALVAWGRRLDARLTTEAVTMSRRNAELANALRDGTYAGVSTLTRPSL
ncbi:hypothetical protein ABIQ69_17160 [Agromyces sp. G08B096]|uniref:Uncharacterized protein n=1 Tax=Agromyces sp. G08B096 TaxID=3156399 RepID=A0AAU7W800_9MICO